MSFGTSSANTRNLAIIAHVDHGKTTLVDGLIRSSGVNHQEDRLMDSGDLEKEKGITIESKVISLQHNNHIINIVDTPGHQDFGGEVERVLSMVDGVLLVVCATEGVMRQTQYVLQKASGYNLKPVIVVNKVDRPSARIEEVEEEILELFFDLNVDETLLDYKTFYSSAKLFAAFENFEDVQQFVQSGKDKAAEDLMVDPQSEQGMTKILDYVIDNFNAPKLLGTTEESPKMLVSQIEYDQVFGKLIRGKLESGRVQVGDVLTSYDSNRKFREKSKIGKIFKNNGLYREELTEAFAGDIVSLSGFSKSGITDTLSSDKEPFAIESPQIDRPMVCVEVYVNTSPYSGQTQGARMSFNEIKTRLQRETERDLALRMEIVGASKILLFGRGELHIGVVLEKMRREGFELMVSCPKITMRKVNDVKLEPIENLIIDCDLSHVSLIIDMLMARQAIITDQVGLEEEEGDRQRITANIPTRGLIGLKVILQTETNNRVLLEHSFWEWQEHRGPIEKKQKNMLIAAHDGDATAYGIYKLEKFGTFFVKPGHKIYMGQIIGVSTDREQVINVCKEKKLTNVRSAGNDENIKLNSTKAFTIEEAISFIGDDDYLEITKNALRMRKKELNSDTRKNQKKRKLVDNDLIIDLSRHTELYDN